MERTELVEEIVRRVTARLHELEGAEQAAPSEGKPGLLILTQAHGTACHSVLESEAVRRKWRVDCALQREYNVELADYDAVLLGDLSCSALDRIASGAGDCAFTRLAVQAILAGKKVYILVEGVELYRYRESAPAVYYKMLQQKLDFLQASGAVLCTQTDVEQLLTEKQPAPKLQAPPAEASNAKEKTLAKRGPAERDLIDAEKQGVACIRVGAGCIITALAKDLAAGRGITIIKGQD